MVTMVSTASTTVFPLVVRNLKRWWRTPVLLAFGVIQPVIWMLLFSQSFKRLVDFPEFRSLGYTSYLSFFVPSIMALTVLNASIQSGVSVITDVNTGVMDKFLINPISRSGILLGRILADAITMAGECLIVLAIAFVMGARSQTGVAGVFALLVIMVFLGVCAAAFSDFVALHTRNTELTMVVGMILTLVALFLSPAFFPLALQPHWLRIAAKVNPVAYAVTSGQNLLNLGVDWGQLLTMAAALVITAALCFWGSIRMFRQATSG